MVSEYPLDEKETIIENPDVFLYQHSIITFVSGNPQNEQVNELLSLIPLHRMIIIPNEEWVKALKAKFSFRLIEKKNSRWKLSSSQLSIDNVASYIKTIPEGYTLEKINEKNAGLFLGLLKDEILGLFDEGEFLEKGFGYCIRSGDDIVCAAATGHPPYNQAFEIQVVTDKKHRKKGLATIACAALIKYSLEHGFKPQWDAANKPSVKLAEKLGYTDPIAYNIYFHTVLPLVILRKTRINVLIY
ncbi:MAG: GNAT family N-acetyltransferase, partial [Candidatus Hodarchaeales archaeon]